MKNNSIKNKKTSVFLFCLLFCVLFSVVMYFCPHTVDDVYYDYLNINDLYNLIHFSAGYGNGRVLGNALGVIMCKSAIFAAVLRGASITYLMYIIVKLKNKSVDLLSLSLVGLALIGIGGLIFGEVYSWISAFANYIPPVLITLTVLTIIKYYESNSKFCFVVFLVVILLASSNQLFNESATLNGFGIAFITLIYVFFTERKKLFLALTYFGSTIIGTIVMLYARVKIHDKRGIYDTVDYGLKFDSLKNIVDNMWTIYQKYLLWFPMFFILFAMVSVVGIILIHRNSGNIILKTVQTFSLSVFPFYILFYSVSTKVDYFQGTLYLFSAITTVLLLLYLLSFSSLFLQIKVLKNKLAYIFCVLLGVFNVGYYLLLSPVNPRCSYYTYICFIFAFIILFDELSIKISKNLMLKIAISSVIAVFMFLIPLHVNIYNTDKVEKEFIQYQVDSGKKEIIVFKITNTDYFHHSYNNARLGYTYYRKKPMDLKFKEVPLESWYSYYSEKYAESIDNKW